MEKETFKFYRQDPTTNSGQWEDVNPDEYLWHWEAEYQDGTFLKQFDTDNPLTKVFGSDKVFPFHQIREINISELKYLHIVSPRLNKRHAIIWNPRWQLVIIYRRANLVMKVWYDKKHFDKTGKKVEKQVERRIFTAFIYGYTNKVGGIVVKHFNVIMPNGEIVTTDNLDNIKLDATPKEEWI